MKHLLLTLSLWLVALLAMGQAVMPSCQPTMRIVKSDGTTIEVTEIGGEEGNAPLRLQFEARPQQLGLYTARYEWRFQREGDSSPFLVRYDEQTEHTFTQSGSYTIRLLATFSLDGSEVTYEQEVPFVVSISESKLEWPNAFTPNGDGINDVFRAKDGYRSLVEFHATVVNRWGKKVAEWRQPSEGWDGRINGQDAPDGAYFFHCEARGADGVRYHFKKTINLLRKYMEISH